MRRWCCCCTALPSRSTPGARRSKRSPRPAIAPWRRASAAIAPSARPDTADTANYEFDKLVGDAMDIAAGAGGRGRFHLVGHDWGGSIAWGIADKYPERLASLTILSRPHPVAFNKALMAARRRAGAGAPAIIAGSWRPTRCRGCWPTIRAGCASGSRPTRCRRTPSRGTSPISAMRRRWRRRWPGIAPAARSAARSARSGCRRCYIWGDADDTVGRAAAEGTVDHVSAPYRFEVLPGGGHFVHEQMPEQVSALLLAHLKAHPA